MVFYHGIQSIKKSQNPNSEGHLYIQKWGEKGSYPKIKLGTESGSNVSSFLLGRKNICKFTVNQCTKPPLDSNPAGTYHLFISHLPSIKFHVGEILRSHFAAFDLDRLEDGHKHFDPQRKKKQFRVSQMNPNDPCM